MTFPLPNNRMSFLFVRVSDVSNFYLIYGFDVAESSVESKMVLDGRKESSLNMHEILSLLKKLSGMMKKQIFSRSAFYQNLGSIFDRLMHTSWCAILSEVMAHETYIYMI